MNGFDKVKNFVKSDCKNCEYYKDKTKWEMCKVIKDIEGNLKCVNKKEIK